MTVTLMTAIIISLFFSRKILKLIRIREEVIVFPLFFIKIRFTL